MHTYKHTLDLLCIPYLILTLPLTQPYLFISSPLPTIEWQYPSHSNGGNRLRTSQNGAVLNVRAVQASDAGQYVCTATGVEGTFTATLVVRGQLQCLL